MDAPQLFAITIKNVGQSPARNLRYIAVAAWQPRNLKTPCADMVRPNEFNTEYAFDLTSGDDIEGDVGSKLNGSDFMIKDTNNGPRVPMVFGIVWYTDVFKRQHTKRFAFQAELVVEVESVPKIGDQVGLRINLSAANTHNDET